MSEIKIIDKKFGEIKINDVNFYGIHDEIINVIEQLQRENEFLKKADKITYETSQDMLSELKQENEKLKRHLIVPENVTLKTLEDYKNYYTNTTKEDILNDTYMDYCAYLNTIHILNKFGKWLEEYKNEVEPNVDQYIEASTILDKLQEFKEGKK